MALARCRFTVAREMPSATAISPKSMPSTYRRTNTALCLSHIPSRLRWMHNMVSRTSKSAGDDVAGVGGAGRRSMIRRRQANRRTSSLTTRTATENTKLRMDPAFSRVCNLRKTRKKTS